MMVLMMFEKLSWLLEEYNSGGEMLNSRVGMCIRKNKLNKLDADKCKQPYWLNLSNSCWICVGILHEDIKLDNILFV